MYFPFVYGRQSEFLALRAMLKDHRSLDALVPVIEPVKRKSADLIRCIESFGKADETLAVILTPDKHELKAKDAAKDWSDAQVEASFAVMTADLKPVAGKDSLADALSNPVTLDDSSAAHKKYVDGLSNAWRGAAN